jgi:hypothetical protein
MGMPLRRPRLLVAVALLAAAGLTTQFALGRKKDKADGTTMQMQMDARKRAVHALNRLTFGPRTGDVDRVMQLGVDKWIELELHPDKIDDTALESRLGPFRTLRMDTKEIVENFPPNQLIKQIADGKAALPRDPTKRAVYEAQLQRYEDKQDKKEEAGKVGAAAGDAQSPSGAGSASSNNNNDDDSKPVDPFQMRRREERRLANLKTQELLDLPADERMKEILQMSPGDRRALAATTKGAKR